MTGDARCAVLADQLTQSRQDEAKASANGVLISDGSQERHWAQAGQSAPAGKVLRSVRAPLHLAQEMGARLGSGKVLFR